MDGLQINDIEPFCQDEIALYRQCLERRDKELRQKLQDSEHRLGLSMPLDQAKERASQLESEVTKTERKRLESLNQGIEKKKKTKDEPTQTPTARRWFLW